MRLTLILGVVLIVVGLGSWWFFGDVIRGWFEPGYTGLSPAEEAARQKAIAEFNERANQPVENREPGIRVLETPDEPATTTAASSTDESATSTEID